MSEAAAARYEPMIPTATEYSTVGLVRSVINDLDNGDFMRPALLVERMLWNPRLRGVVDTRLDGLIATTVQWEPRRENPACQRAAKAMQEDWPRIAAGPVRKQMAKWGLFLGLSLGQRVPMVSVSTGRLMPVVRPYWTGFAIWDQLDRRYAIQVDGLDGKGSIAYADSPTLTGRGVDPAVSPWIVSEPFGANSWREALVHAAWRPWLGHEWAMRDQSRASEKHGIGVLKYFYDAIAEGDEAGAKALARFSAGLRNMGSEGRIPCQRGRSFAGGPPESAGYDVQPLEFSGTGFQAIADAMNACAIALAILWLGHNLTTEIKGGSFAAAGVADYIRDDKKNADAAGEWTWVEPQLAEPWALWNFGDPAVAPVARYVTDSPAVNQAAAQTYAQLANALDTLARHGVDTRALAERFRLPVTITGRTQGQVPGGGAGEAAAPCHQSASATAPPRPRTAR